MQFLTYLLTSSTITLGLFIGLILTIISPEELEPGKKYFKLAKHILFYLIIALSISLFYTNKVHLLIALVMLVIYFLEFRFKEQSIYLLLSILFYLSISTETSFLIIASALFIYSIFLAIDFRLQNMHKNNMKIAGLLLVNYVWFLVGGMLLFLFI